MNFNGVFATVRRIRILNSFHEAADMASCTMSLYGHFHQLVICIGLVSMFAAGCGKQQSSPVLAPQSAVPHSAQTVRTTEKSPGTPAARAGATSSLLFRTVGWESGFDFVRYDDMHGQERIFEVMGGGAAVFDFDSDGWLDIYMTNGCRVPLSMQSRETPGKLFRNQQRLSFVECSQESGLMQFGFCSGCAVGDANEDGFEDLYIAAFGPNQLWINNGDGSFSPLSAIEVPEVREWSSSVAFADLNGDRALDLYVANYLVESDTNPKLCRDSKPGIGDTGCTPPHFEGVCDRLLISNGEGAYVDASASAGLLTLPGKALGVAICDFGGNDQPEIYVANDIEANYLFRVQHASGESEPDRTAPISLQEQGILASLALGEQGYAQGSMGVAVSDLDRNGLPDIFLTHFFTEMNTLYLNQSTSSALVFQDSSRVSGLGPSSLDRVGFGVAAIDVDNNGWKDLLIANGHTNDRSWEAHSDPFRMRPQLYQNQGAASFVDVSASAGEYFQCELLGRGLATGDFDRDGRIDAVVSQQLDQSVILRNETKSVGSSLVLRLIGRKCCRTPVATRVILRNIEPAACEHLVGGGGFQSASANEIHFGLADAKSVDLEILWPGGDREIVTAVAPGYWTIRQGDQRVWSTIPFEPAAE